MNFFQAFFRMLILALIPNCVINAGDEDETCEKSGRKKRFAEEENIKDNLTYDLEEIRRELRKHYTLEENEYATSRDGWLEIYQRQQKMKKSGGCEKKKYMFLSDKEITDLVSSPKATFFEQQNFKGETEDYDFLAASYGGGCHNLSKLSKRARSLKTSGKCVRIFDDVECSGLSLAIYPGNGYSKKILSSKLKEVESIGPCLEQEFLGSFFQDQTKTGISKRIANSAEDFPDLAEFGSNEKYAKGEKFPSTHFHLSSFTLGPQNRVDFLYAAIATKDLVNYPASFDPENYRYFQSLDKAEGDVLGFGISPTLGGPAKENFNIFPQSPSFQRAWALQTLKIQEFLQNGGDVVELSLNFIYPDERKTRPSAIYFFISRIINKNAKNASINYGRLLNN